MKYNKLKIVIISGGSGSKNLFLGIKKQLQSNKINFDISFLINAYDDGKSTGYIRNYFNNNILGPSDLRKLQYLQYKNLYNNNNVNNFFNLRLNFNNINSKTFIYIT